MRCIVLLLLASFVLMLPLGCKKSKPAAQLVAYYPFDGMLKDCAGSNDGRSMGAPSYASGRIGQAIQLHGENDYIVLPAGIADSEDITLAMWIQWDGGSSWQYIFDFGNSATSCMYLTPRNANDNLEFGIRKDDVHDRLQSAPLPAGVWTHVVIVLGGDLCTLYINGKLAAVERILLNPSDIKPSSNSFGRNQWTLDPFFKGKIDDFSIYDGVLPEDSIIALAKGMRETNQDSNGENTATAVPSYTITHTGGDIANGTYEIVARHSGKCLAVGSGSKANGGSVIQWPYYNGAEQQWTVTGLGDGVYRIDNVNSGKTLDVNQASMADGAKIKQWEYSDSENQQWRIIDVGEGYYRIESVRSGKILSVKSASTADGADVIQWSNNGGQEQQFQFINVSGG